MHTFSPKEYFPVQKMNDKIKRKRAASCSVKSSDDQKRFALNFVQLFGKSKYRLTIDRSVQNGQEKEIHVNVRKHLDEIQMVFISSPKVPEIRNVSISCMGDFYQLCLRRLVLLGSRAFFLKSLSPVHLSRWKSISLARRSPFPTFRCSHRRNTCS